MEITRKTCDGLIDQLMDMLRNGEAMPIDEAYDVVADGTILDLLRRRFPSFDPQYLIGTRWAEMNDALRWHAEEARDRAARAKIGRGDGLRLVVEAAKLEKRRLTA